MRTGDPVVVLGLSGRGATWSFVAHVVHVRSGAAHVEVVGGRPGDRTVRAVDPSRVHPPAAGRRGGPGAPSLAVAPRLPLG
ncbi:MAG: hypothetical protein M0029_12300 [Actinomycetota bacterium]|nr:hypothetical protein [Actinomycetota bacterium]